MNRHRTLLGCSLVTVAVVAVTPAASPAARTARCTGASVSTPSLRLDRVVLSPAPRRGRALACRRAVRVLRAYAWALGRPRPPARIGGWTCRRATRSVTCRRAGVRATARLLRSRGHDTASGPGGGRWYSDTVSYFNAATEYASEVARAAEAWNRSGVGIRWVPVPRAQARVIVSPVDELDGHAGSAPMPGPGETLSRGEIQLVSGMLASAEDEGVPEAQRRASVTVVAAHEMGHVMGLAHEDAVCALMNPAVWKHCDRPAEPWRYRCRILEVPDLVRAVGLYGGAAAPLEAEFCSIGSDPPPVTELSAAAAGPGSATVTWRTPNDPSVTSFRVFARSDGACATGSDADGPYEVGDSGLAAAPGAVQSTDIAIPASGNYCVTVVTLADFGGFMRPSAPVSVGLAAAGPEEPPAQ